MSDPSQNRSSRPRNAISDPPQTTDIAMPTRLVRFVPLPDSCTAAVSKFSIASGLWLFNNFVGKSNQLTRHGKSDGLGGFEVDDQFELERLCFAKKPA
jgi:hypothetical protein